MYMVNDGKYHFFQAQLAIKNLEDNNELCLVFLKSKMWYFKSGNFFVLPFQESQKMTGHTAAEPLKPVVFPVLPVNVGSRSATLQAQRNIRRMPQDLDNP